MHGVDSWDCIGFLFPLYIGGKRQQVWVWEDTFVASRSHSYGAIEMPERIDARYT
jgi:hypothetical protein